MVDASEVVHPLSPALVLGPAGLPPLPDQAVIPDLGKACHLSQEVSHYALIAPAEGCVAKQARQFSNEGIGPPMVLAFVVPSFVAFDESSSLLNPAQ